MDIADARELLITSRELARMGIMGRGLAGLVAAGELVRVHRGHYIAARPWASLYPEQRHLVHTCAVHDALRTADMVLTRTSAAVVWGLPLPRADLRRVHVAGMTTDGRTRAPDTVRHGVARHEIRVPRAERVGIDGLVCTSLMRTVADLLRLERRETALAAADAAARLVAVAAGQDVGDANGESEAAAAWRDRLVDRLERVHGARGVRQARELAPLVDARAQLPGESISRLYLADLGYARPRLQVPLEGPDRTCYFVDFGLDDANAWGEFDGHGKYTDPSYIGEREPWEVLAAEKARHDWIHGTTGRRIVRWGSAQLETREHFAAHLAAHGVTARAGRRTPALAANPVGNGATSGWVR